MNNQIIFNINQKIDWQVDSAHEAVSMLPGEVCVFRNKNYATSMNYEGEGSGLAVVKLYIHPLFIPFESKKNSKKHNVFFTFKKLFYFLLRL